MATELEHAAESYAALQALASRQCLCREADEPDERHLQALWQDSIHRPRDLALPDGTPVEVLDAGRWNRSAGPDFQDALIAVGGFMRRGDVELHVHPADWDAHRHASDPAYAGLVLHVSWHEGPPAKTLPEGVPTLALRPFAEKERPFCFADLDLSCAPYTSAADVRPCRVRLSALPGETDRLLASAGTFRLLAKARAFTAALSTGDAFQAFYAGLLTAMGYGRNTGPFHRLAEEVPFTRIERLPSLTRFATLAGTAGLLRETQRDLWDLWWQSGLPPPLEPYAWDFRAMRPANHPFRRLAGAIGILHHIAHLLELPLRDLPQNLVEASNLLAEPLRLKGAPIGRNRANAIVTNLFVPYRLALGTLGPNQLKDLPGEDVSMPMRDTWHRLTGDLQGLPKDGLRQQGLLQIHADFCKNPRITCPTCPLA